ncbi:MAG: hypothetical protein ACK52I_36750 [Pseudomonadota bacterium]|jgi:hypothetical protein
MVPKERVSAEDHENPRKTGPSSLPQLSVRIGDHPPEAFARHDPSREDLAGAEAREFVGFARRR